MLAIERRKERGWNESVGAITGDCQDRQQRADWLPAEAAYYKRKRFVRAPPVAFVLEHARFTFSLRSLNEGVSPEGTSSTRGSGAISREFGASWKRIEERSLRKRLLIECEANKYPAFPRSGLEKRKRRAYKRKAEKEKEGERERERERERETALVQTTAFVSEQNFISRVSLGNFSPLIPGRQRGFFSPSAKQHRRLLSRNGAVY